MKKLTYIFLLSFALISTVEAQEKIYFEVTEPQSGRVAELEGERFKMQIYKGNAAPIERTTSRPNIMFFFNAVGNYLVTSQLSSSPTEVNAKLRELYATTKKPNTDIIIKYLPTIEVIQGTISYESDDIFNYLNLQGKSASISKKEVVAVIKKDGSHALFVEPRDAEKVLIRVQPNISNFKDKPVVVMAEPVRQPEPKPVVEQKPLRDPSAWSAEERTKYEEKGVNRVYEFVQFVNIISDRTVSGDIKDSKIKEALQLFQPDATVQVSSKKGDIKTLRIENYFRRIKLLAYSNTSVEMVNVSYATSPTKEADGNYYGMIQGEQVFTGFGKDGKVKYSDVTKKSVRVKFQPNSEFNKGQEVRVYDVLLGNISIVVD